MGKGTSESASDCETSVKIDALWLLHRDLRESCSSHGSGSGSGVGDSCKGKKLE